MQLARKCAYMLGVPCLRADSRTISMERHPDTHISPHAFRVPAFTVHALPFFLRASIGRSPDEEKSDESVQLKKPKTNTLVVLYSAESPVRLYNHDASRVGTDLHVEFPHKINRT
jgi:hypothetical protein